MGSVPLRPAGELSIARWARSWPWKPSSNEWSDVVALLPVYVFASVSGLQVACEGIVCTYILYVTFCVASRSASYVLVSIADRAQQSWRISFPSRFACLGWKCDRLQPISIDTKIWEPVWNSWSNGKEHGLRLGSQSWFDWCVLWSLPVYREAALYEPGLM